MHDVRVPITVAAGEESLVRAAEVCFAEMCAPNVQRTHMYLDSVNQWCTCTLVEMVLFQWCTVATRTNSWQQVPTELMAEFDATVLVVGPLVAHWWAST